MLTRIRPYKDACTLAHLNAGSKKGATRRAAASASAHPPHRPHQDAERITAEVRGLHITAQWEGGVRSALPARSPRFAGPVAAAVAINGCQAHHSLHGGAPPATQSTVRRPAPSLGAAAAIVQRRPRGTGGRASVSKQPAAAVRSLQPPPSAAAAAAVRSNHRRSLAATAAAAGRTRRRSATAGRRGQ